jgi:predicted alpha/beta hydrolase family esterase
MQFVIFHGSFSSSYSNWFPELKEKLELIGQEVLIPEFTTEDWKEVTGRGINYVTKNQNLQNWLRIFENKILPMIKKRNKLCFVAHSLAPLFVLHILEKYNIKLDCAIFVSPFLTKLNKSWQIDLVNSSFYKKGFNFNKLKKLINVSYTLYSENDPYVDKKYSIEFAKKLNSSLILVKGAGHMNSEVNLNKFPLVFELCKTRLNLSLYQKYINSL